MVSRLSDTPISLRLYRGASRVLLGVPLPSGKLAESLAGRRVAADRWVAWASARPAAGPRIWAHAASVGEALTLRPVLSRLQRSGSTTPEVLHTYTSPSVQRWPDLLPATRSDFLPLDTPGDVARALDAIAPALLVIGRGDLWPELLCQAARRRIPVAVVGATMRRGSLRHAIPFRSLYARALASVSWIGAVTAGDAERWRRAGAPGGTIEVSGDPRHDEVLERLTDLHAIAALEPWAAGARVLVAGSVEPADETPLFRAAAIVLGAVPEARLLVVPHDADAAATLRLHARAKQAGLAAGVWAGTEEPPRVRCLIAPVTGVLYDLYALGTIAYVGGGFTPGKLHSVIEPAAYAVPILTGPRLAGAADAERLAAVGALTPARRPDAPESIAAAWQALLQDVGRRTEAGLAARRALDEGAAARSAERLRNLLPGRSQA